MSVVVTALLRYAINLLTFECSKIKGDVMFKWLFGAGGEIKTLSPGELQDRLRDQERPSVLVDVRESNEWAGGRIPGAVHAPLSRFEEAAANLPKDKAMIFYCASGMRSKTALRRAKDMGFDAEAHLGGGLSNWARHDFPVQR